MFGTLFNNKFNLTLFFLFLTLVILDQFTKALVINFFNLYDSVALLPMINLTFVVNYGFAFGLLNNPSLNQILVSLVILAIIIYFLYLLIKTQDKIFQLTLTLILAGALGNFVDRIFRGLRFFIIAFIIKQFGGIGMQILKRNKLLIFVLIPIGVIFLIYLLFYHD